MRFVDISKAEVGVIAALQGVGDVHHTPRSNPHPTLCVALQRGVDFIFGGIAGVLDQQRKLGRMPRWQRALSRAAILAKHHRGAQGQRFASSR
jgi:hypothetical protein